MLLDVEQSVMNSGIVSPVFLVVAKSHFASGSRPLLNRVWVHSPSVVQIFKFFNSSFE